MDDFPENQVLLRRPETDCWLLFSDPIAVIETRRREEVLPVLEEIDETVNKRGYCAAGFISYEAAPALDPALNTRANCSLPLLWFGIYRRPVPVTLPKPLPEKRVPRWRPSISRAAYFDNISRIKELIARGETYQVNYSFRLRAELDFNPYQFFLRRARRGAYAAFLDTGRYAVASLSPELFFRREKEIITSRPMKGTIGRGASPPDDSSRREWLRNSEKNRAENLMIVDMIRNDLGRIAQPGSVKVSRLFQIEPYPDVWQMTSTVTARSREPLPAVMRALFPCASVTGAPKPRTMEIIAELEDRPRRVYCGAIGSILPGRREQFSVAIRTLLADREDGSAEYGVGGGIMWDSKPEEEYEECRLKGRTVTEKIPEFALLETILWQPGSGYFLLPLHCARLGRSAAFFGFRFDEKEIKRRLRREAETFKDNPRRIRLLISAGGMITLESSPLAPAERKQPVRLRRACRPVDSGNLFLYHKTTNREVYDSARQGLSGCDDVLFYNEKGEITETTIANILIEKNGQPLTPPVSSGLLAGTFREDLLQKGECREEVMTWEDILQAEAVYTVNSVRGRQRAEIIS